MTATKPRPDFPLYPHRTGRWAKKIRGRTHYFGRTEHDPDGTRALAALHARHPGLATDVSTMRAVTKAFLHDRRQRLDAGELAESTYTNYRRACAVLDQHFGDRRLVSISRRDFANLRHQLAAQFGPSTLQTTIGQIRAVINWANEHELLNLHLGKAFEKPSRKVLRRARNQQGPNLFTAEEIRRILGHVPNPLRAMVLLGINCAFGNTDVASLPQSALQDGWLDYPRPKTEIPRRCPLWRETEAALRECIATRPDPKDGGDDGLCFLTRHGTRWVRHLPRRDNIHKKFGAALKQLGINGRKRLSFYTLRHNFETVAGSDQAAIDAIMGHLDGSNAAAYRELVPDERLTRTVQTVRHWLWG